jgi:hypothetical protein
MRAHVIPAAALLAIAAAICAAVWIHVTFGIIAPWQTPRHIDVCGHQYREGGSAFGPDSGARVLALDSTVFQLPIPLPDLHETDIGLPYGGCPAQVILRVGGLSIVYGFVEGGP